MIIKNEFLSDYDYIKSVHKKNQIVLHHTVSSTAQSTINWFKNDGGKSKVAVAFVIDKDGTIYKLFEPKYWAWHLGKGSNTRHNAFSIGIEIVNEGGLVKKEDKLYWFDGKYEYKGDYIELEKEFRGYKYFAKYTKLQVLAVHELIEKLIKDFEIEKKFSNTFNYDQQFRTFNGVILHCNVQPHKTDLSPAWDLKETNDFILSLGQKKENYGKEIFGVKEKKAFKKEK